MNMHKYSLLLLLSITVVPCTRAMEIGPDDMTTISSVMQTMKESWSSLVASVQSNFSSIVQKMQSNDSTGAPQLSAPSAGVPVAGEGSVGSLPQVPGADAPLAGGLNPEPTQLVLQQGPVYSFVQQVPQMVRDHKVAVVACTVVCLTGYTLYRYLKNGVQRRAEAQ